MRVHIYLLGIVLLALLPLHAAEKSVSVFAAKVHRVAYSDTLEALGTLRANEEVSLFATVSEVVTGVYFNDNERVKKGKLLVQLESAEEEAALLEEEAKLQKALRQLARLEPLAAKGAASESALDESRVEVQTAKARIAILQSRLAQRRIVAPFDGVLGLRNVSVGMLLSSDTLITTIDDDSVMKLDFTLPSRYLNQLHPDQEVVASSRAFELKEFHGEVSALSSRIDPVTRAFTVRARLDNAKRVLKPGLLMQVRVSTQPRKSLILPESCVVSVGKQHYVMEIVSRDDAQYTQRHEIVIGSRTQGYVEVLKGIEEGALVVSQGLVKLKPDARVEVARIESGTQSLETLLKPEDGAP
jgi:membrane fusion protein (multidrug efflux system)